MRLLTVHADNSDSIARAAQGSVKRSTKQLSVEHHTQSVLLVLRSEYREISRASRLKPLRMTGKFFFEVCWVKGQYRPSAQNESNRYASNISLLYFRSFSFLQSK